MGWAWCTGLKYAGGCAGLLLQAGSGDGACACLGARYAARARARKKSALSHDDGCCTAAGNYTAAAAPHPRAARGDAAAAHNAQNNRHKNHGQQDAYDDARDAAAVDGHRSRRRRESDRKRRGRGQERITVWLGPGEVGVGCFGRGFRGAFSGCMGRLGAGRARKRTGQCACERPCIGSSRRL